MGGFFLTLTLGAFGAMVVVWKTFIVVSEREQVIKERLGKFAGTLQPGFHFLIPFIERPAYRQEMREQAINVPSQSCITRDNIQVEVDGVVYLKVQDPQKASYGIGDYIKASVNLAQTTMRSEIGKLTLDETFSERDLINENIVREIDKASEPWGVKMIRYEIMNITPSHRVVDTMEKQMEAERDKRAQITITGGQKHAQILQAEGQKISAINQSEGERARRINESAGRAEEIRLLADASAEGVRLVAEAIQKPGGNAAVKTQLVEQFVDEYGKVLQGANISVVPAGLAKVRGFFEGVNEVGEAVSDD
jgi:regulator of protease activity HflC (stomatin/prohibitin superfamily)